MWGNTTWRRPNVLLSGCCFFHVSEARGNLRPGNYNHRQTWLQTQQPVSHISLLTRAPREEKVCRGGLGSLECLWGEPFCYANTKWREPAALLFSHSGESSEREQRDAWKDGEMNHGGTMGRSTEAHEATEVREAILSTARSQHRLQQHHFWKFHVQPCKSHKTSWSCDKETPNQFQNLWNQNTI